MRYTAGLRLQCLRARREIIRHGTYFCILKVEVLHLLSAYSYNLNLYERRIVEFAFTYSGNFKISDNCYVQKKCH